MPPGDPSYEDVGSARERARRLADGPRWAAPGLVVVAALLLVAATLAAADAGAPAWEPWSYLLVAALLVLVAVRNVMSIRWARQFLAAWPDDEAEDEDPDDRIV